MPLSAEFILEASATLTTLFFYLSPFPSIMKVHYSPRDVYQVNLLNLLSMHSCCFLWVLYGLFLPMPAVVTPNVFGTTVSIFYVGSCWWHVCQLRQPQVKTETWNGMSAAATLLCLAMEAILFGYVALPANVKAAEHVGFIAMLANTAMYGAPLSTLGEVITEKSSASLPPLQCALGLLSSGLWTIIAVQQANIPVAVPNVFGFILSAVQLALIAWFPVRRKAWIYAPDELDPCNSLGSLAPLRGQTHLYLPL